MQKRVKVEFNAQSKAVVENVVVEYIGDDEEFKSSTKYLNDSILKEAVDLQLKAAEHARQQTMLKQH